MNIIDKEACSFLWFAAIQSIKRKQDLAALAPKDCLIAAQPIEGKVGQIGQTQKARGELNGRINGRSDRISLGNDSWCVCEVARCRIGLPEQFIEAVAGCWESLAGLPEVPQIVGLNFEQAVSIVVAQRNRHNRLANRNTSSRSTAD